MSPTAAPASVRPLPPAGSSTGIVLMPVKAFAKAKARLGAALDETDRAALARQMATHVVVAQQDLPVAICCDDAEVAEWATLVGAYTIWCPGTDLNGAVQQGFAELRAAGYRSVAIAHSDLPLASSFEPLLGWPGVTLVPDRHRTGSNVIALPTTIDFVFSYGESSMQRHVAESIRHRRGLRIVHDRSLGWDVDDPADLETPGAGVLASLLTPKAADDFDVHA